MPRRARKPGVVQIWDTETLKPKCECSETDGRLEAVSFSPDGRSIAIAGGDTAWIYETEHGDRVVGPMRHAKNINALAYSPNGTMIATASEDETARLWDTENGKPIGGPIFHAGDVEAVAFSPDGQTLATADFNGLCRLQNLPRPPLIYAKRNTHENVPFATLSPDGRVGLEIDNDVAQLYTVEPHALIGGLLKQGSTIKVAIFTPDSRRLITAGKDGTLRIWMSRRQSRLASRSKSGSGQNRKNHSEWPIPADIRRR